MVAYLLLVYLFFPNFFPDFPFLPDFLDFSIFQISVFFRFSEFCFVFLFSGFFPPFFPDPGFSIFRIFWLFYFFRIYWIFRIFQMYPDFPDLTDFPDRIEIYLSPNSEMLLLRKFAEIRFSVKTRKISVFYLIKKIK